MLITPDPDMESSDEIVVATPNRKSSDVASQPHAAASPSTQASGKVDSQQTTEASTPDNTFNDDKIRTQAIDLAVSSSRSSSPLSDIDEGVLQAVSTLTLPTSASDNDPSSGQISSSPPPVRIYIAGFGPADLDSSSTPPSIAQSTRKRSAASASMQPPVEPPAKRPRGRPRKTAPATEHVASKIASDDLLSDSGSGVLPRPSRSKASKKLVSIIHTPRLGNRLNARRSSALSSFNDDFDEIPRPKRKTAEKSGRKEEYRSLHLYEESNWVLFDPVKGFPGEYPSPPKFLEAFTNYEPGNDRILEYNIVSNSVRLKSTPHALKGKSVDYGESGPRLVD